MKPFGPEDRVFTVEYWVPYEGWNELAEGKTYEEAKEMYDRDPDERRVIVEVLF